MEPNPERPDFSKMSEHDKMRYWVENWKRVGPELERIKREELRALSDEDAYQNAVALMSCLEADFWEDPRRSQWSGLVEQQRLFQRALAWQK